MRALWLVANKGEKKPFTSGLGEMAITSRHPEVMRVVSLARVLRGFGVVFEGQKSEEFHAPQRLEEVSVVDGCCSADEGFGESASPSAQRAALIHRASVKNVTSASREEADTIFCESVVATQVDVFISHVWGVPRWKKALGVYYYFNVDAAIVAALVTWGVILSVLVSRNGLTGMGGNDHLVPVLAYIPIAIFFLVLFTAHYFRPDLRVWLDKLCVHQEDEKLKKLGIASMLEIVSCSQRLCILWDDTYFERLWCNAEVATFSATHGGAENIDFVPLWLPPWIIAALLLDILCSSLAAHMSWVAPALADVFTSWLGSELWVFCLVAACAGTVQYFVGYLPLLVPNFFALTSKISQHKTMLEQLKQFHHAGAKCTVESDRKFVGEHICALFRQGDEPDADAMGRFDEFMNSEFLEMIEHKVGTSATLRRREAFLVVLPLIFTSSAIVLGCDGDDCTRSAANEMPPPPPWFDQLTAFMITNGASYAISSLLCYPMTYPIILQMVERAMRIECCCLWRSLVALAIATGSCWMGASIGITCGFVLYATQYGGVYLVAAAVYIAVLVALFVSLI